MVHVMSFESKEIEIDFCPAVVFNSRGHFPSKVNSQSGDAESNATDEIAKEGWLLRNMRHPHIAQVFVLGKKNGITYMDMEYCEGGDLHHRDLGSAWHIRILFSFKFDL